MIDGIDIRKIRISSLRRHFGQMLQDVFLFSGTIRSNIVPVSYTHLLGLLALYRMWCMDRRMTMLALIPAAFMFAIGTVMGKTMTKTWEKRQQAFSDLSDFAQENFSGIAVIKAFVKELKELIAFRKLNKDNEEINVEYTRISVLLEVMVTFFVE